MLNFRIIIPECSEWEQDWYCKKSFDFERRINLLKSAIETSNCDLIITSHNFFAFKCEEKSLEMNKKAMVINNLCDLINNLNTSLTIKKPLITGIDFFSPSVSINPYCGINAMVVFFDVKNNKYFLKTYIWECWIDEENCNVREFIKQNEKRIFEKYGIKFGLLSCGDIANYCHKKRTLLPKVDIYVNLSHKSLKGHTSQYKNPPIILKENKAKIVIGTHQVKEDTLKNKYCKKQEYPFLFINYRKIRCVNFKVTLIHKYLNNSKIVEAAFIDFCFDILSD